MLRGVGRARWWGFQCPRAGGSDAGVGTGLEKKWGQSEVSCFFPFIKMLPK